MQARFCIECGSPLERKEIDGLERLACSNCKFVYFERLIVGAGAYIENDGALLLIRRKHEPFRGHWSLPSGHVEATESPAQAAIREVREETGLVISVKDDPPQMFYTNDLPGPHRIFFAYHGIVVGGKLCETKEAETPMFFSPNMIPQNLCGGGPKDAILAWSQRTVRR